MSVEKIGKIEAISLILLIVIYQTLSKKAIVK